MLHLVIYTNFMPAKFDGFAFGPIVLIRPKNRDDKGMLAHELTHVKQFWRNPLYGLFSTFSKKHRQKYEVEAYRAQLPYHPDRIDNFAWALANHYSLNITQDEAKKLLTA